MTEFREIDHRTEVYRKKQWTRGMNCVITILRIVYGENGGPNVEIKTELHGDATL